jgi:hypothetical protein
VVNKIISLLLFGIWFKLYNVFFYSFFDIPVEFVTGAGVNQYKLYWLIFFIISTAIAIKGLTLAYKINHKRIEQV